LRASFNLALRPDSRVLLAFSLVVLFLGVNFVAVRFSNRELQPFWGATLRFALASVILFAVVRLRRIPLPRGGALTGAVLLGATAFGVNFAFLYWGLLSVTASAEAKAAKWERTSRLSTTMSICQ